MKDDDFDEFMKGLLDILGVDWSAVDDYHISLSRTFPIRYHWIDGLYNSLKSTLKSKP